MALRIKETVAGFVHTHARDEDDQLIVLAAGDLVPEGVEVDEKLTEPAATKAAPAKAPAKPKATGGSSD